MGHSTLASTTPSTARPPPRVAPSLALDSLGLAKRQKGQRRGASLAISTVLHAALLSTIVILPLFWENSPAATDSAIRAFLAAPQLIAPPPPPPPPPALRVPSRAFTPAQPQTAKFTAPTEVPAALEPEPGIDLGIEGGAPGGVEGGVPGGIVILKPTSMPGGSSRT